MHRDGEKIAEKIRGGERESARAKWLRIYFFFLLDDAISHFIVDEYRGSRGVRFIFVSSSFLAVVVRK